MPDKATPIHWGRIVIAAVMSEAGVIAVLLAATAIYPMLVPARAETDFNTLGEEVGYYVAPAAGAVTTFVSVLWVARKLSAGFVAHGLLVGVVSVLLTIGFVFSARPAHRLMYMIAFGLRILAGYAGGLAAQRAFQSKAAGSFPVGRLQL
jgi:hypothetical protein